MPPGASRWGRIDTRTKVLAGSAGVAILAAVLVLTTMSSGTPAPATSPVVANTVPTTGDAPSTTTTEMPTTTLAPTSTTSLPAAGGGSPTSTVAAVKGPRLNVAIIGDSITVLSEPSINRAFRGNSVYIDAVIGTTIADHLATMQDLDSEGRPLNWVIELGTNDALQNNVNWNTDFANEVTALQSQPCVNFLTVNPRLGPISTSINAAIASAVAAHPNFHSIDWGTIEFENPHWLRSDQIHPTKSGAVELAKVDRAAIDACPGA